MRGYTVRFFQNSDNLFAEDVPYRKRSKRLNDAKIQLDRIDSFLKDVQLSLPQKPVRQNSLLAKLPLPKPPPQLEELSSSPGTNIEDDTLLSPPLDSGSTVKLAPSLKPSVSTKGLFIVPPDPAEVSPSLISTALPSLLPINPSETARTSAFKRTFGPTPTSRRDGAVGNQATTALHEELSSQLELMAQQLKRNAIHFSSSLANDKAVIEEASEKIEGNFNVMQGQRIKLRDRTSQSRSNTCLIMGIILLVFLLFMLMIMIIRLL